MQVPSIDGLSLAERLELIARLCESLEPENLPLSPAQHAELQRRLDTADADLARSVPWSALRAELASRSM